ncbi:MAG: HNH endonuclease [Lysobacteraceae bacterium]|nr:MAG: HNH endonuclease [Xanthomonadaceae bacterium]
MIPGVLDEIRPTERRRVIDLVREAGLDVSDWADFKGDNPAENPKYCYEWAFTDHATLAVLNLWYESMFVDESGHLSQQMNYRRFAIDLESKGGHAIWARRARALDLALQDSVRLNFPIRVIVNEGRRQDIEQGSDKASKVARRRLDVQLWSIAKYDWMTGDCLLVRGLIADRYVDQFSLTKTDEHPDRIERRTSQYPRSEQVRIAVLIRACGCCEYCKQPGFETHDGRIYLETHHVIPLSEGGRDHTDNVAALCPEHHRQAHYGASRDGICFTLLTMLGHIGSSGDQIMPSEVKPSGAKLSDAKLFDRR